MTYTDDELINHIQRLATDTSPPTRDEFDADIDAPSSKTVHNRFGSWNNAVSQAGFTPNRAGDKRTYATDELIDHIQRLATDTSPPTRDEFDADPDAPSSATVHNRLASWNDALVEAGFDTNPQQYTTDKIIDHIQRLATDTSPPTRDEFDADPNAPSTTAVTTRFDSWNDAVTEAGFDPNLQQYTTDELLDHICRLATDTSPPTAVKFDADPDTPSSLTVRNKFESWNDAVTEAGFDPNLQHYTPDELINHIQRLAIDDTPPTAAKFDADPDAPSSSTVKDRFGSWDNAVSQAGLTPNPGRDEPAYTPDELIDHIQRLATDTSPPTRDEFNANPDAPSSTTVIDKFGSWNDAVTEAGFDPNLQHYTPDELINHIQRLATDDTPPTRDEFDADPDAPSSATVIYRFGNWNDGLAEAGFDPNTTPEYSDNELIAHIRRLATDDTPPTAAEFDADPDTPSSSTVRNKFESWNDAVTEAGFDPNLQHYTPDELINHIQRLATNTSPPTLTEFDADPDAPSSKTVVDRFGSWNDALTAAGFDPRYPSDNEEYTEAELREWVVSWTVEFGDPPGRTEFKRAGPTPSPVTYESRFDGTFTEIRDRILDRRT